MKNNLDSLVDLSLSDNVENEKCVVSSFRTTPEQKQTFKELVHATSRREIPIEWVIDIADEANGWFYGTAYHFYDTTKMLHVMVPDKDNPSFDGMILLDYRTVRLVECVDGKSDALFNKIIRDSIIKIKWELEWFECATDDNGQPITEPSADGELRGVWKRTIARYYIRIANQLLVEDDKEIRDSMNNNDSHIGYVMLAADNNVRLINCLKDRGVEDFCRLITEEVTLFTPEAAKLVDTLMTDPSDILRHSNIRDTTLTRGSMARDTMAAATRGSTLNAKEMLMSPRTVNVRRLADVTLNLKDTLQDIKEEKDLILKQRIDFAQFFYEFTLNGDLDSGLSLLSNMSPYIQDNNMDTYITQASTETNGTTNNKVTFQTSSKKSSQDNSSSKVENEPISELLGVSDMLIQKLESGMLSLLRQSENEDEITTPQKYKR